MRLPRSVYDDLKAHAVDSSPRECCGLLLGSGEHVSVVVRTPNTAPDPKVGFVVLDEDREFAFAEARRRGLDVVALYHSHPMAPALPSIEDVRCAEAFEGLDHLIVGLGEGLVMRAFRVSRGSVRDVPLEVY